MCLKRIIGNEEEGVYGSAWIKKRRYWSRRVHGKGINNYFRSKNIGYVEYLSGEWDETKFNFFKEHYYSIMIMSTFSVFTMPESQKEERSMVNGEVFKSN